MAKKQKEPPPAVGDHVRLKGRLARGILTAINPSCNWCWVSWDMDAIGPKIVHLNELERCVA